MNKRYARAPRPIASLASIFRTALVPRSRSGATGEVSARLGRGSSYGTLRWASVLAPEGEVSLLVAEWVDVGGADESAWVPLDGELSARDEDASGSGGSLAFGPDDRLAEGVCLVVVFSVGEGRGFLDQVRYPVWGVVAGCGIGGGAAGEVDVAALEWWLGGD